jgi:hypothetical protein
MLPDEKITLRSRLGFIRLGYLGSRIARRLVAAGFPPSTIHCGAALQGDAMSRESVPPALLNNGVGGLRERRVGAFLSPLASSRHNHGEAETRRPGRNARMGGHFAELGAIAFN